MPDNKTVTFDASQWQLIETVPKDGSVVDLWIGGEFAGRRASCFWGKPSHDCGEHGRYCDSDWHDLGEGWVDDMNMPVDGHEEPTHWMPLPAAPTPAAQSAGQKIIAYLCKTGNDIEAIVERAASELPDGEHPLYAAQSAGQEAVAWGVYWGVVRKKLAWPPYSTKEEAERAAEQIKSDTEVRPLYASPVNGGERDALHVKVREQADKIAELQALLDTTYVGDMFAADAQQVGGDDIRAIRNLLGHIDDVLTDEEFDKIDIAAWNAVSAIVGRSEQAALTSPAKVGGDEREAFERFARSQTFIKDCQRFDTAEKGSLNEYGHWESQKARHVWLAALDYARAAPSADGGEEAPSFTNPLTPYGMLVRALRITTATTLMDMARYRNVSPSLLSGMELGRKPVTIDDAIAASGFFSEHGVAGTLDALTVALQAAIAANQARKGE